MIQLLLRLPLVLAIVLPVAWALVLLGNGAELALLQGSLSHLREAYPSETHRERLIGGATQAASLLQEQTPGLGGKHSPLIRAGLAASMLHLEAARGILPITLLLALSGAAAGLVLRERIRIGAGYASPTAAGLGRGVVAAGILWLGLFALSPVPVSYAWVYLTPAALALGGTLYVANLPLKL